MKNRYISALITAIMLIQSFLFSTASLAWENPAYDNTYAVRAEAIMESLEFINTIDKESETVSRMQFIKTLMELLKCTDFAEEKCVFSDVKGELSGLLNHALEMHIVSESEHFRPDAPITYAQALKMCLVAAGYEYDCASRGGWPGGVISVAYGLNLDKNIKLGQNDALSGMDALTLLYNLMNIKSVNIKTAYKSADMVGLTFETDEDTLLSVYHGIYKIKGVITENSRTSLYKPKTNVISSVEINSEQYFSDKKTEDLIGYNVEAFVKIDSEKIIAAFPEKNNVTVLGGESVQSIKDGKITYLDKDDKKKSIKGESDYDILYNGKAYKEDVNEAFLSGCEYIHLIDNDNDNVYEVMALTDISYTLAEKINYVDKIIYTHSRLGKSIDMSDEKGQYTLVNKEGEEMSIYKAQPGMLFEAAVSQDGLYAKLKQSDNMIVGSITATSYDELLISVDNTEYKITEDFKNEFSGLKAGTKGNFYIGANGKIVMYQKSPSRMQFGYVIKVAPKKSSLSGHQIRMLCENGQIKIFDFAEKVTVDDDKKDSKEAYDILSGNLVSDLIRFRINENNAVCEVDTAISDLRTGEAAMGTLNDDAAKENDSLVKYFSDFSGSYMYKAAPKALQPKVNLSTTRVFVVPSDASEEDETKYKTGTCDIFSNDFSMDSANAEIFNVDKYGNCEVLLYKGDVSRMTIEDTQSAVIEKIRYERDRDDVFRKKIYLIAGGKYISYFLGKDIDEASLKGGGDLCVGDIIRYRAENEDISTIKVDFDSAIDKMAKSGDIPADHFNGGNQKYHYQAGKIYSINDKTAYFSLDSEARMEDPIAINRRSFDFSWGNLSNFAIPKNTIVKVTIHSRMENGTLKESGREVSIADLTEVESYLEKGENADYAVLRQNAFEAKLLVVYKFVE